MPVPGPQPEDSNAAGFGSTNWTLVLEAKENQDGGVALNRLCARYWRPVFALVRRSGLNPQDAEDATQDFFAYVLDRAWLHQADRARGSFRAFLFTLLKNFMANRRRVADAQKRGGTQKRSVPISEVAMSEVEAIAAHEPDAASAYERIWAISVSRLALERLGAEQASPIAQGRFAALQPFLVSPPSSEDYDRLSQTLGVARNALAVHLHRLTRRYGELIRAEVADTLVEKADVELELRCLVQALGRTSPPLQ